MGNYNTLKTAIANVIKQNGNNEITGNILQESLLAMINSLGLNYQYVGIATPETQPGTPDQNVFYFAYSPGLYANFGNLTVDDGEIAILKYNGIWVKDATNILSKESIGVFSNTMSIDTFLKTKIASSNFTFGNITTSGSIVSINANAYTPFFSVKVNEQYVFSFTEYSGRVYWCLALYDANKNFVSRGEFVDNTTPITIPSGVYFARLCISKRVGGTITDFASYGEIDQNNILFYNINNNIENIVFGKFNDVFNAETLKNGLIINVNSDLAKEAAQYVKNISVQCVGNPQTADSILKKPDGSYRKIALRTYYYVAQNIIAVISKEDDNGVQQSWINIPMPESGHIGISNVTDNFVVYFDFSATLPAGMLYPLDSVCEIKNELFVNAIKEAQIKFPYNLDNFRLCKDIFMVGFIGSDGNYNNYTGITTCYIPIYKSGKYIIDLPRVDSDNYNIFTALSYYDEQRQFISRTAMEYHTSFDIPSTARFIRLSVTRFYDSYFSIIPEYIEQFNSILYADDSQITVVDILKPLINYNYKKAAIEREENKQCVIGIIGDSWTQHNNDPQYISGNEYHTNYVEPLVEHLRNKLGNAGGGFYSFDASIGTIFMRSAVYADADDTRSGTDLITYRDQVDGAMNVDDADATFHSGAFLNLNIKTPHNKLIIHFWGSATAGTFTYKLDNDSPIAVNAASYVGHTTIVLNTTDETHTLRFEITSGDVMLFGVDMQRTNRGVRCHKIANKGATADSFAKANEASWEAGIDALGIDCFTIMLGTNDGAGSTTAIYNALTTIIGRIRAVNPYADICLVQPSNNKHWDLSTQAIFQHKCAIDNNVDFLNLIPLFGSVEQIVAQDTFPDTFNGIHPTLTGGRDIANYMDEKLF